MAMLAPAAPPKSLQVPFSCFTVRCPSPRIHLRNTLYAPHRRFALSRLSVFSVLSAADPEAADEGDPAMTARERREIRHENRKSSSVNWREQVETRLMRRKPKRRSASWTEDLNLDLLARLGPQWWAVKVSRLTAQETADRLLRSLARSFPLFNFKVYYPCVHEKKRLNNGTFRVKSKPLFPGCVFLHCILNKEIHDFVREVGGVGGFVGSRVGNTKRMINKPKPVQAVEMETILEQARAAQATADEMFEETDRTGEDMNLQIGAGKATATETKSSEKSHGLGVHVISGPFKDFTGTLMQLDKKNRKATVVLVLFGKENLVDLDIDQIEVVGGQKR